MKLKIMGKLIEKEGRFYKECGVVMLPTEIEYNPSNKIKNIIKTTSGKLFDTYGMDNPPVGFQHLYITSDDEIKDGDWFVNLSTNQVHQAGRYADICHKPEDKHCKKIIATTDSSIGYTDHRVSPVHNFCDYPKPSQSFILKYIDAYNKGEKIEKVLVEYNNWKFPHGLEEELKLKDNNIIIKKAKDSWTREEVRSLFNKYVNDMRSNSEFFRKHEDMPGGIPALRDIWMEENL